MATYTNLNDLFTAIADSIRLKDGSTAKIVADTFPEKIINLKTGFDYDNHETTEISDYEFYGCDQLNNVNCYSLTSVGASAFENCTNLETIILYDGVTNVGENAFKGCTGLTIYCEAESKPEGWNEKWNPDGCTVVWGFVPVETWDISATENDNVIAKLYNDIHNDDMYTLIISGSGDMIHHYNNDITWYSYQSKINFVIIDNGVTSIGDSAFRNCTSLTSVSIPDSVTSIGNSTFSDCTSLTSITIPDSIIHIYDSAFSRCTSLTSIILPNSLTSISYHAFYNCTSLTSIIIPDSVTSIDDEAFYNCTSLSSITIPDSVIYIHDNAFLNTAYYDNPSNWENDVLYIGNHLIKAKETLSGAYEIKDGIVNIIRRAFYYCTSLTSIIIPDSVTHIDVAAFSSCTSLTYINIPDSVTSIGSYAFQSCSSLTSINIPNSVTHIYDNAFSDCTSLTSIAIPDSVTSIDYHAFSNCKNLTSITYTGTISQWNIITFGNDWNYNTPDYIVHCTDGNIAKDGTIITQ